MEVCIHCEKPAEKVDFLGLCDTCNKVSGYVRLYQSRPKMSPEWDAHLNNLRQRAKNKQPIFEEPSHEQSA